MCAQLYGLAAVLADYVKGGATSAASAASVVVASDSASFDYRLWYTTRYSPTRTR